MDLRESTQFVICVILIISGVCLAQTPSPTPPLVGSTNTIEVTAEQRNISRLFQLLGRIRHLSRVISEGTVQLGNGTEVTLSQSQIQTLETRKTQRLNQLQTVCGNLAP